MSMLAGIVERVANLHADADFWVLCGALTLALFLLLCIFNRDDY